MDGPMWDLDNEEQSVETSISSWEAEANDASRLWQENHSFDMVLYSHGACPPSPLEL